MNTRQTLFQIGDAVRIIQNGHMQGIVGRVVTVDPYKTQPRYAVNVNTAEALWFSESELERVKPDGQAANVA